MLSVAFPFRHRPASPLLPGGKRASWQPGSACSLRTTSESPFLGRLAGVDDQRRPTHPRLAQPAEPDGRWRRQRNHDTDSPAVAGDCQAELGVGTAPRLSGTQRSCDREDHPRRIQRPRSASPTFIGELTRAPTPQPQALRTMPFGLGMILLRSTHRSSPTCSPGAAETTQHAWPTSAAKSSRRFGTPPDASRICATEHPTPALARGQAFAPDG